MRIRAILNAKAGTLLDHNACGIAQRIEERLRAHILVERSRRGFEVPPDEEFVTYLLEQLAPLEGLARKRLFGGYSLSRHDVPFAIIFDNTAYFKVDDTNRADYEARGSGPFTYQKQGRVIEVSNWEVPTEIIEDQEELLEWARKAYGVALKGKAGSKKKSGRI